MKHKFLFIAIMWIVYGTATESLPFLEEGFFPLIPIITTLCLVFNVYPHSPRFNKYKGLEKKVLKMFEETDTIQLNNAVTLTCEGKSADHILFHYNDEQICSLTDFKNEHPEQYKNLLMKILEADTIKPINMEQVQEDTNRISFETVAAQIDAYNIDIPDEEISLGLYNCSNQLKYLQKLLLEYPTENDKLNKLENYYLPILLDILESYHKISKSDDAAAIRKKLNQTLVLVNEAIKNITRSLFDEEKMNLNVDMSVLENLLKKDGLVEDEMNRDQLKAFMEAKNE